MAWTFRDAIATAPTAAAAQALRGSLGALLLSSGNATEALKLLEDTAQLTGDEFASMVRVLAAGWFMAELVLLITQAPLRTEQAYRSCKQGQTSRPGSHRWIQMENAVRWLALGIVYSLKGCARAMEHCLEFKAT